MCDTQNADNTQEWKLMFSQITDDGTKTVFKISFKTYKSIVLTNLGHQVWNEVELQI